MNILRQLEIEHMKTSVPDFGIGDTVDVHYRIKEGDKERIQLFTGTVISIKGRGIRRTAPQPPHVPRPGVGRAPGEGVERVFPLHSPRIADVKVRTRGKVRRAKLYYLRDREGKATRVKPNMGPMRYPRSIKGDIGQEQPEPPTDPVPESEAPGDS